MDCKNGNGNSKELALDLLELGKFYYLNEKYEEAVKVLMKAKKFDPLNADIFYNLGIVYETQNIVHEAKDCYLKAIELDPKSKNAQEHLDKLVGNQ